MGRLKRLLLIVLLIPTIAVGAAGQKSRDKNQRPPKDRSVIIEKKKDRPPPNKDRRSENTKKKPSTFSVRTELNRLASTYAVASNWRYRQWPVTGYPGYASYDAMRTGTYRLNLAASNDPGAWPTM